MQSADHGWEIKIIRVFIQRIICVCVGQQFIYFSSPLTESTAQYYQTKIPTNREPDRKHIKYAIQTELLLFCSEIILKVDCIYPSWLYNIINNAKTSREIGFLFSNMRLSFEYKPKLIYIIHSYCDADGTHLQT